MKLFFSKNIIIASLVSFSALAVYVSGEDDLVSKYDDVIATCGDQFHFSGLVSGEKKNFSQGVPCYSSQAAFVKKDPNVCNLIPENACSEFGGNVRGKTGRAECLAAYAYATLDVRGCEMMGEKVELQSCQTEDHTHHLYGTREFSNKPGYSASVDTLCFQTIADYTGEKKGVCNQISDRQDRENCFSSAGYWKKSSVKTSNALQPKANAAVASPVIYDGLHNRFSHVISTATEYEHCMAVPDQYCVDAHQGGDLRDACIYQVSKKQKTPNVAMNSCLQIKRTESSCSNLDSLQYRDRCITETRQGTEGTGWDKHSLHVGFCEEVKNGEWKSLCIKGWSPCEITEVKSAEGVDRYYKGDCNEEIRERSRSKSR